MREIYALGVGHSTPLFIEIAEAAGWHVSGLYHYNDERTGEMDHGVKILGSFDDLFNQNIKGKNFLLTMGDMQIRKEIAERLVGLGGVIPTIIHPYSSISRFVRISNQGVIIGNGAELQNDVIVNEGTLIRSGALVGHNTTLGSNVFVGPKALVGAFLAIDDFAFIGQGSILVSRKATRIGSNTLIGAGSIVTKPIEENLVAVGNPARVIKLLDAEKFKNC